MSDPITVLGTHPGGGAPIDDGDIVRWLLTDGRALSEVPMFDALCWRLVGAGVPVWRATLHLGTLHPQIRGHGWRWWRDRGVVEELQIAHTLSETEDFLQSPIRPVLLSGISVRHRLDELSASRVPLLAELGEAGATDYVAAPLTLIPGRHGAATFATDRPGGFSADHLAGIEALVPALGVVAEARMLRRAAHYLLDTYVGSTIGRRILDGQVTRGVGERLRTAILSSDLRGFTNLSDRLPGDELIELLDDYFEAVAEAVHERQGEVLKFVGDGVLAVFAADTEGDVAAAERALGAAEAALARLGAINATRRPRDALRAGMGLHLGDVIYGNVGAATRLDFTAIGPAVNLACRLEGLTKRLDRPLLASHAFAASCPRPLVSLGFQPVRGMRQPVEVFGLPV